MQLSSQAQVFKICSPQRRSRPLLRDHLPSNQSGAKNVKTENVPSEAQVTSWLDSGCQFASPNSNAVLSFLRRCLTPSGFRGPLRNFASLLGCKFFSSRPST
jgi:hypothetical protein